MRVFLFAVSEPSTASPRPRKPPEKHPTNCPAPDKGKISGFHSTTARHLFWHLFSAPILTYSRTYSHLFWLAAITS